MTNDNQPMVRRGEAAVSASGWKTHALYGGVAVVVILADQVTKSFIWNTVGPGGDRLEIGILSWLRIIFVRNTGSAFGMFQGQSGVLTVLGFLALIMLGLLFYNNARRDALVAVALGLIAGGAIGNLIDRIRLGYVIDWIDLPRFPTFNVADSAVTVGVTVLVFSLLFRDFERSHVERRESDEQSEPSEDESRNV